MKKTLVLLLAALAFSPAFAWHHHHYHHHHHHGGSGWGAVGAGLAAGVVGAALYNAVRPEPRVYVQQSAPVVVQQPAPVVVQQPAPVVVQQPAPVVVQQPVVQQVAPAPVQNVWVEGAYINQTQPDGTVQRVWNPGHYEQR